MAPTLAWHPDAEICILVIFFKFSLIELQGNVFLVIFLIFFKVNTAEFF